MVLGAVHGGLGRVALLLQQLLEGVQLVGLVQGREVRRLRRVTAGTQRACQRARFFSPLICFSLGTFI